jgi:Cu+-exporting ATPase
MHPEIVRKEPGNCPICGMALEPKTISSGDEPSSELADMKRRFLVSLALTIPVLIAAMGEMIPGQPLQKMASQRIWTWVELILSTPVIL